MSATKARIDQGTEKRKEKEKAIEALVSGIVDGVMKACGQFISLAINSRCFASDEVADEADQYHRKFSEPADSMSSFSSEESDQETRLPAAVGPLTHRVASRFSDHVDSMSSFSSEESDQETRLPAALGALTHQVASRFSEHEDSMPTSKKPYGISSPSFNRSPLSPLMRSKLRASMVG